MAERTPRLHLHPDGQVLSIGFTTTNDTNLFLHGPASENWGDAARLKEWVEAVAPRLRSGIVDVEAHVFYLAKCSGCGEDADSEGYADTPADAERYALEHDWIREYDRLLCFQCASLASST